MKTLEDLTTEEFEQLLDDFIEREDEEMGASTFFAALELIDKERRREIIDVEGEILDGKLVLSLSKEIPAWVEVHGNEILLDENRKIIVHLKTPSSIEQTRISAP